MREAYEAMVRLWSELEDAEGALALPRTGMPDAGLAWAMHRWASGQRLEDVLRGTDLAAGDFVRRCKQVIDLLGQLTDAGDPALQQMARKAADSVMRGSSPRTGSTDAGHSVDCQTPSWLPPGSVK